MSKTLLIVDDEPFIRSFFKIRIERQWPDLKIIEASDGDAAWKFIQREKLDLITIDINMPFVNGIELISKIKAEPDLSTVPIIVISANVSNEVQDRLRKYGITDIIGKIDITGPQTDDNPLIKVITKYLG
jgi:two-component system chemotaxis response regulator CheY